VKAAQSKKGTAVTQADVGALFNTQADVKGAKPALTQGKASMPKGCDILAPMLKPRRSICTSR